MGDVLDPFLTSLNRNRSFSPKMFNVEFVKLAVLKPPNTAMEMNLKSQKSMLKINYIFFVLRTIHNAKKNPYVMHIEN